MLGALLLGFKDLFEGSSKEVTLENDDGLFDADEQISVPDTLMEGK